MANHTDSNLLRRIGNQGYIITMTTLGVLLFLFTILSFITLQRTKIIPETARFLTSGLLVFDMIGILGFTLKRFFVDDRHLIFVHVIAVYGLMTAVVTVGIMSFERLVIFLAPYFYLNRVTPRRVKYIVTTIWVMLTALYFFIRYGTCFIRFDNVTMFDVVGKCRGVSYVYYALCVLSTCITSAACYIRIFLIERKNVKYGKANTFLATFKEIMKNRTTGIVFLYGFSIFVNLLPYLVILIALRSDGVSSLYIVEISNLFSCVIDPCLYVLWFRESRYELMKIFSFVSPRFADKLETMRIEIFNVVLTDRNALSNNKVDTIANSHIQRQTLDCSNLKFNNFADDNITEEIV